MLKKIVRAETNRCPGFEISVGNLGAFPSTSRPRVVWVGVEAPQELFTLQRGIENEAAQLGYAPENRPFSPHLTLGRLSRNARTEQIRDVGESLVKYKIGFLGLTRVNEVHLYKSDLRPGGAVYTSIYASPLQSEGS
jgi:2'-5' RNA ligase